MRVREPALWLIGLLLAAAAAVPVVMWDNAIDTFREHERRITTLEEKVHHMQAKEESPQ